MSLGWFFSDIVNCDLKSTLRVLYNLFTRYRHVEWVVGAWEIYLLNGQHLLYIFIRYCVLILVWWKLVCIGGDLGTGCHSKQCFWTHPDIQDALPCQRCHCMFIEKLMLFIHSEYIKHQYRRLLAMAHSSTAWRVGKNGLILFLSCLGVNFSSRKRTKSDGVHIIFVLHCSFIFIFSL